MTRPVVSVVTIFYNAEKFLAESIDSVRAQTYENWELVLVDDGSSDSSAAIARRYASRDKRIRYVAPRAGNEGMTAARNRGSRAAHGEFIAFVDADDVWLPQKLERQVALFAEWPEAGMVYGPTLRWYSWTGRVEHADLDFTRSLGITTEKLYKPPALLPLFLRERAMPCTCSMMLRSSTLREIGGFFEDFQGMYEDQIVYAKVAASVPIYVSSLYLDKYRKHEDSACAVAVKQGTEYAPLPSFIERVEDYLRERGLDDADVWRALDERRRAISGEPQDPATSYGVRGAGLRLLGRALRSVTTRY